MISTVPTLLQRQGIFTEAIGGRVPAIYDPATTARADRRLVATPFPGNTIPPARIDPVALALLQRYPLPTCAGTANNYRRVGDEIDDQDQVRRAASIIAFARPRSGVRPADVLPRDRSMPVTPLPDGSGVTTGTLGPQDTTCLGVRVELPAHVLRPTC